MIFHVFNLSFEVSLISEADAPNTACCTFAVTNFLLSTARSCADEEIMERTKLLAEF
jgi:hypothetical protein